jgi:hypothetical protein
MSKKLLLLIVAVVFCWVALPVSTASAGCGGYSRSYVRSYYSPVVRVVPQVYYAPPAYVAPVQYVAPAAYAAPVAAPVAYAAPVSYAAPYAYSAFAAPVVYGGCGSVLIGGY